MTRLHACSLQLLRALVPEQSVQSLTNSQSSHMNDSTDSWELFPPTSFYLISACTDEIVLIWRVLGKQILLCVLYRHPEDLCTLLLTVL